LKIEESDRKPLVVHTPHEAIEEGPYLVGLSEQSFMDTANKRDPEIDLMSLELASVNN
jgi:hypothetical protein